MRKFLFFLSIILSAPLCRVIPALALQEVNLGAVVISANRMETPAAQSTATVDVIDREEIEAAGATTLEEIVNRLPGVYSVTPGGPADLGTTRIRGAKNEYTQIRLNDFILVDPTSPKGDMRSFQSSLFLPPGSLDRVEVLKGAQSTLYGSSAVGGVISLFPAKTWNSGTQAELSLAAGSFSTQEGTARLAWGDTTHYLNFTPMYVRTDGFREIGAVQQGFLLGAGKRLDKKGEKELELTVYHTGSRLSHYDSPEWLGGNTVIPQKPLLDPGNHTDAEFTLAGLTYNYSTAAFDMRIKTAYSQSSRTYFDNYNDPGISTFKGETWRMEWLNTLSMFDGLNLTAGADYDLQHIDQNDYYTSSWSGLVSNFNPKQKLQASSLFFKSILSLAGGKLNLDLGGRYNFYDHFAGAFIYNAGAAWIFDPGLRLYANTGAGYRIPSIYEMYDKTSGNLNLKPEESLSYEFGLEQNFLNQRAALGVVYFHNDFKNMIAWDNTYYNKSKARTRGVELSAAFRPVEDLTLRLAYTQTKAEDLDAGIWIKSKNFPQKRLAASLLARPWTGFSLSLTGRWQDGADVQVFDSIYMSTILREAGFFTLDCAVNYDVHEHFSVFGKFNNLLNKKYTLNFNEMPGINASAGIKIRY